MKINERWEELREESNANIQSEESVLKRQTRSIQTEGHFGDIKEKGFLRPKIESQEKDETIPQGIRAEKSPNSAGTSHPCFSGVKIGINRQPLFLSAEMVFFINFMIM